MGSKSRFTAEQGKAIAKRFRDFRERNLITQEELAQAIGILRPQISLIECEHYRPSYKTMRRFVVLEEREKSHGKRFLEFGKDQDERTHA